MDFSFLSQYLSPEAVTFIVSMLPVSELRGAIPLAIGVYNIDPIKAYVISVVGNMVPVFFLLLLVDKVSAALSKESTLFERFFRWQFEHTRRKNADKFQKWGSLALVVFVAIPLPVTGAWSGSIAAFVFGIPFKKAFPLIFAGVLIAGLIVSGLTLGIL
ncbi:MAG: small multi-drug export protein [Candidatus Pacebacteria bacterium]|nr:small multi-drug export protein [Candidatus Paceibacterota bacterium]